MGHEILEATVRDFDIIKQENSAAGIGLGRVGRVDNFRGKTPTLIISYLLYSF